eukprot:3373942-Ditylum_brightwellii.AAC.1
MHNWLNTGTQKQKLYEDAVANCPMCCAEKEEWTHLFQCKHDDLIVIRSLALTKYWLALIKIRTIPIIRQEEFQNTGAWHRNVYSNEIAKAFDKKTWMTKLIKVIWSMLVVVWNARNAHLHTEWESATNNVLDKQVRKAFALKHWMFQSDRMLFQTTLLEWLESSL